MHLPTATMYPIGGGFVQIPRRPALPFFGEVMILIPQGQAWSSLEQVLPHTSLHRVDPPGPCPHNKTGVLPGSNEPLQKASQL